MPKRSFSATLLASALSGSAIFAASSARAQMTKVIIPKPPVAHGVPASAHGAVVHQAAVRHVNPVVVHERVAVRPAREEVRVETVHTDSAVHFVAPSGVVVVVGNSNGRFPRLHAALEALIAANQTMQAGGSNAAATEDVQKALHELSQSSSNPLFQGHRQGAIDRSIRAVHMLERGVSFEEPASLTRAAIDDLQFCVSVP